MSKSGWLVPASLLITSMAAATAQAAVFNVEPLQIPAAFNAAQKGQGGLSIAVTSVLEKNGEERVVGLIYGEDTNKRCFTRDVRFKHQTSIRTIECARALNGVFTPTEDPKIFDGLLDPLTADTNSAADGYIVENVARDIADVSGTEMVVGYSHKDFVDPGEWPTQTNRAVVLSYLANTNSTQRTAKPQLNDGTNNVELETLTTLGNEDGMANAVNSFGAIAGWSRYIKADGSNCVPEADDFLPANHGCTITDYQRAVVYPNMVDPSLRKPVGLGVYQSAEYTDTDQYSYASDISSQDDPVVVGRVGDFSRLVDGNTVSWARGFWFRVTNDANPLTGHGSTYAGIGSADSASGIVAPVEINGVANPAFATSLAAINDSGVAVGSSQISSVGIVEAISFDTESPSTAPVRLGQLETDLSSSASAIGNGANAIIGGNAVVRRTSVSTGSERHGFLYFPSGSDVVNTDSLETMLDASNLIDCNQGIVITGINKIVGDDSNPVIYASAVATAAADDSLEGKVFSVRLTRADANDPTAPSAPQVCVPEKPLNDSGGGAAGGLMVFAGWLAVCLRRRKFLK